MTYDDLIKHFGSQTEVARAFGVTSASVSEWQDKGVPPLRQVQAEGLTGKKLTADSDVFTRPSERARVA